MGRLRLTAIVRASDRLTAALGLLLGLLVPAMVLLVFALVVARYAFGIGSIAAQEAVLWLHAAVFMLGASVALRHGRHVRVDVLQQRWSARTRAIVEAGGTLLWLLPFCAFVFWLSLDYVDASWRMREGSREPGGLPALYLLKGMIPLAAVLLALQGLVELLRRLGGGDGIAAAAVAAEAAATEKRAVAAADGTSSPRSDGGAG